MNDFMNSDRVFIGIGLLATLHFIKLHSYFLFKEDVRRKSRMANSNRVYSD
jgi:hypothetical protein